MHIPNVQRHLREAIISKKQPQPCLNLSGGFEMFLRKHYASVLVMQHAPHLALCFVDSVAFPEGEIPAYDRPDECSRSKNDEL